MKTSWLIMSYSQLEIYQAFMLCVLKPSQVIKQLAEEHVLIELACLHYHATTHVLARAEKLSEKSASSKDFASVKRNCKHKARSNYVSECFACLSLMSVFPST